MLVKDVSHWLGASLASVLYTMLHWTVLYGDGNVKPGDNRLMRDNSLKRIHILSFPDNAATTTLIWCNVDLKRTLILHGNKQGVNHDAEKHLPP